MIFLGILMFPQLGTNWIHWVLLGFNVATVPLLLIYRHDAKRTAADSSQHEKQQGNEKRDQQMEKVD